MSGQRGLADWVVSRHVLARRLLRGPLLVQFVAPAPAPERRAGRARTVFRPRLIADSAPRAEGALRSDAERSLNAEGVWAVAPPIVEDAQPAPAAHALPADTYLVAHDDAERPAAAISATAEPTRLEERAADIAPPAQQALPPRERLGRRVEERVQEMPPPMASVAPIPAAPTPERAGATAPPRVEQPLANAPAPYQATTLDTSDAGDVIVPQPENLSSHSVEATEPDRHSTEIPSAALPPEMTAPALPDERRSEQRSVIQSDTAEHPAPASAPRDEAIASPAAHASAVEYEAQGRPTPPETATQRPERSVSEERHATPVRESSPAETPGVERDVVAERPQSNAPQGVPAATPAASVPSPATAGETPVADLFASRGPDRSPAAWLARLTGAVPPPPEQTAAPAIPPAPPFEELGGGPASPKGQSASPPAFAPPASSEGATPPFLAPSPRFVAPARARTPAIEPVEREETRADATGLAHEIATTIGLDPQVISGSAQEMEPPSPLDDAQPLPEPERSIIERGVETTMIAASEDDGEIRPPPPMPDTIPVAPPDGVGDAELFVSPGTDRSPAAWIERLRRAESAAVEREPAPPITPGQPAQGALPRRTVAKPTEVNPPDMRREERAPRPLPEASRRFLQPLVGIDPGDVPVHEGARADAVTAAYRADALTDGNVVLLGAGKDVGAPETLGLIAHELTHVARRRDPRFVPPIGRADERAGRFNLPTGAAPETDDTASLADEETLARRVESRVTDAARATDTTPSPRPRPPSLRVSRPTWADAPVAPPAAETQRGERADDPWGGLPAPWEPLPGWLTSPAPDAPMPANVTPLPVAAPALAPVAPVPQLAEEGRESDGESAAPEPAAVSSHDAHTPAPAEPDLDALARQVYVLLKRRLALERRSFG
ncbi:MAG: eCIS core domain-containing protein [Thermomicrobiales bacterium]